MRIDHLVHQFAPESRGGLESYVLDLSLAQLAAGDDVEIISGTLEPRETFSVVRSEHRGLPVTRLHRADLYFDAWDKGVHPGVESALRERWTRRRPDVVHVHHWIRLSENLVEIARDMGLTVVVTLHDFATSCPRAFRMYARDGSPCFRETAPENCGSCAHRWPWYDDETMNRAVAWFRRNSRVELARAGARICASRAVADILAGALDLDRSSFEILPLGYAPRFGPARPARSGPDQALHVAYWGSVTERKGVPFLAAALRRVHASGEAVQLDVYGGIDRPELEEEIRRAAGELPLTLHGRFDYEQLAAATIDVAVFPSLCLETYGFVIDEARELGLPAIVPREGAMAERLGAGGLDFPIGDADRLTELLGGLAGDRSRLEALRAGVEAPEGGLEEHRRALAAVYARAGAAAPSPDHDAVPAIPRAERAQRAFERAEQMFRALLQGG